MTEKPKKRGKGNAKGVGPADIYKVKKGQVLNPTGGKKEAPGFKALKNLTAAELVEMGNLIVRGRAKDLAKLEQNPNATTLEKMIGAVCTSIIINGDMGKLDQLLSRLIGKVPDKLSVQSSGELIRVVVSLPANGREAPKK